MYIFISSVLFLQLNEVTLHMQTPQTDVIWTTNVYLKASNPRHPNTFKVFYIGMFLGGSSQASSPGMTGCFFLETSATSRKRKTCQAGKYTRPQKST